MIPGVPDFGIGPVPIPGTPEELAPDFLRLTAPNPGLMTGPGTNTYVLGHGELAVVDPGPDDPAHRAILRATAAERGSIAHILVTHTHIDHAPGAAALAAETGAEVIGFAPSEGFAPDRRVGEGWHLSLSGGVGLTLVAVHTPGHASDHLCWLVAEQHTLLTGDHVMHGSTVVIRPPDGNLRQYLSSLDRLRHFDPPLERLAPGHGRMMERVPDAVDALIAHRLARHAVVTEALATTKEATVDDLLGRVYDDVTEQQLPVAKFSLWAHLRHLAEQGRAEPIAPEGDEEGVDGVVDTMETRWRWVEL